MKVVGNEVGVTSCYANLITSCDYLPAVLISPVMCTNNELLHTLTCLNNYEAHFNWTLESDAILYPTLSHYDHNISHRIFNYSSLPHGRHEIKLFFEFKEDSLLHFQCSCHHCSCTFSTVLVVASEYNTCLLVYIRTLIICVH